MSLQYDAIVIGSGAGGAAAAHRLVLGGLKVAMLEKGDYLPTDGSTLDIQRVVHDRAFLSREVWNDGRGSPLTPEEHFNVGGKTKWYGAALLRFGDHEFLADSGHSCKSWPITSEELAPYYAEAERLLGVRTFDCEADLAHVLDGLQSVDPRWRSSAIPMGLSAHILDDRTEAAHFDGFASIRHLKADAEQSVLSPLRGRENFALVTNAEAKDLIGSPQSPTMVIGVRLVDGRELFARHTILAAGALHSPRLLSRYLASADLNSALPAAAHVGRYLKLHLLTALIALSPRVKTDLVRKTVLLTHNGFPHSSVQPLGFDAELIAGLVPKAVPRPLRWEIGRRSYGFFLLTEDGSDARNRVIETSNAARAPVLDYDEERQPAASGEHRELTRSFQRALLRAGTVSFTQRIGLTGTAHACGSLVCGLTPEESVVDSQGCVHGMQGLYVVDGSVLPRSSRVNPSLTIYAWGLRVGDLVARQFRSAERETRPGSQEIFHAV